MTLKRIGAGARMSKVVIHNNTVYLSGLVGDSTAGKSGSSLFLRLALTL